MEQELKLDTIVFVREGERAMELALIEKIDHYYNGEVTVYTASYSDGELLEFTENNINDTVFVVAE